MTNEDGGGDHPSDADAPAYEGGRGSFHGARPPRPLGTDQSRVQVGGIAGKSPKSDYEEVKPGTREVTVESGTRMVVERRKDGMYYWLIETLDGNQSCEGVHDPETEFTAEICVDITSKAAKRDLEEMVRTTAKPKPEPKPKKPGGTPQPLVKREIIRIEKGDWLTKLSESRWRTWDWQRYLKPTPETLATRKKKGETFDPHWIYPGDTFEVIDPNNVLAKPLGGVR